MAKYVKINEEDFKINKQVKEYLTPDYIYIPYKEGDNLNVKNKEEIYKDSIILASKNKFVYSPVSGTVMGLCDNIVDGKNCKTIVIENNFKENANKSTAVRRNAFKISKSELIKNVISYGAYSGNLNGNTLIINGIDYEPYEETYSYLISEHTDQILEVIDALIDILDIHKCFFAIKDSDSDNVVTLLNQIGTYPNIELKLMKDYYPIGHKDVLIKELVMSSKMNDGVVYLTVEDAYNIYNVLKRRMPITEKLITIGGNNLNKSKVVNVKIGTRLADIISDEFKIKNENYDIIVNGLLSGYKVNSLNTIITPSIRSIFIELPNNIKEDRCINCGLCHINCPVKADPRTGINMDKCLKCGLCNYICPSKIRLVGDKHE